MRAAVLCLSFCAGLTAPAIAATSDTPLLATVGTPNVLAQQLVEQLKRAQPSDLVQVIIQNPQRVNFRALQGGAGATRRAARDAIVAKMKALYALKMLRLETRLRQLGASRVIPLWASNSIAATLPAAQIATIQNDPTVGIIKPDATVVAHPMTYSQLPPSEWKVAAIHAPQVWNLGYNGQHVVVGVLDSGADLQHQDLVGKWRGTSGWYDPYGQHATGPYDASGHGTGVTSVIVGGNASGGSTGIAPGAQWIAARVFNDAGVGLTSSIHLAMQWMLNPDGVAGTNDAPDVVNASWSIAGAPGVCNGEFEPDIQAFLASDIAIVFAGGNDGPNSASSDSPGNNSGAYAVGAVDQSQTVGSFSSRGPSACDGSIFPALAAPGVNIKVADLTYGGVFPSNYAVVSGTTPAAAHVSGALALLIGAFPTATATDVEAALTATALPLGSVGANNDAGAGQLDVLAAFNLLAKTAPPAPPAQVSSTALVSVTYAVKKKVGTMTVTASNALGAKAAMQLVGFGAMTYSSRTKNWTIAVTVSPEPATITITITAADGTRSYSTAPGT